MNINWFPGHMKKTRDLLNEQLKLVDVVFELLDARIPISSRNPEIDHIVSNKPKIIILNKVDLANEAITKDWIRYFKSNGIEAIPLNSLTGEGFRNLISATEKAVSEKMQSLKAKGRKERAIRVMVVGIPNVGKSSLINKIANRKSAKTGDRPGVTRGKQWIRLKGNMELLDTPGILWPKFEDQEVALKLAFIGSIRDEIMDMETLALKLIERLWQYYKNNIIIRYKIDEQISSPIEVLDNIAKKRGCIVSGGAINYSRISSIILDEFRGGKIGKISLDQPSDYL